MLLGGLTGVIKSVTNAIMEDTEDLITRIEALELLSEHLIRKDDSIVCSSCMVSPYDFDDCVSILRIGRCHRCMDGEE